VFANVIETETMAAADALLLGRRTYDIFARYWPTATESIAERMNGFTKYVASTKSSNKRTFELVESRPTTRGVLITRYQPAS